MRFEDEVELDAQLEEGVASAFELPADRGEMVLDLLIEQIGPISLIGYGLEEGRAAYTRPFYGSAFSDLSMRHYLLIAERPTRGDYLVALALSHSEMSSYFLGFSGGLRVHTAGRPEQAARTAALVACGKDLTSLLCHVIHKALACAGGIGRLRSEKPPLPPWLQRLGWESGLAFGPEVTHDAIVETALDFHKRGIHLSYVLIDEGWQEVADHPVQESLLSFRADPEKFPGGLSATTKALAELGVDHVGVWHGLMGARGGIHPALAKQYGLPEDGSGRHYLGSHLGDTFQFYFDYYEALKKEGVTFIKVGDQGKVPSLRTGDVTSIYRHLQIALQAASSIHFNNAHLNAECLRNENLFYWSTSRIARAGRNLHPNSRQEVYRALRDHLCNSFWLHHLMQPDFDTWASSSPYFETMAIFHSLATSMNAISDRAGEQRLPLLRKLLLPSGKMLAADRPLVLTPRSLLQDPLTHPHLFTATTKVGESGIVGAFNLSQEEEVVTGSVSPCDIPDLDGELFAAYSYRSGFLGPVQRGDQLALSVRPRQPDIYTFAPIRRGIAVIGCHLFFLSRATVTDFEVEDEAVYLRSLVAGPTLLFCPRELLEVRRNGDVVGWDQDAETGLLVIDTRNQAIEMECYYTLIFVS